MSRKHKHERKELRKHLLPFLFAVSFVAVFFIAVLVLQTTSSNSSTGLATTFAGYASDRDFFFDERLLTATNDGGDLAITVTAPLQSTMYVYKKAFYGTTSWNEIILSPSRAQDQQGSWNTTWIKGSATALKNNLPSGEYFVATYICRVYALQTILDTLPLTEPERQILLTRFAGRESMILCGVSDLTNTALVDKKWTVTNTTIGTANSNNAIISLFTINGTTNNRSLASPAFVNISATVAQISSCSVETVSGNGVTITPAPNSQSWARLLTTNGTHNSLLTIQNTLLTRQNVTFKILCQPGFVQKAITVELAPAGACVCPSPSTVACGSIVTNSCGVACGTGTMCPLDRVCISNECREAPTPNAIVRAFTLNDAEQNLSIASSSSATISTTVDNVRECSLSITNPGNIGVNLWTGFQPWSGTIGNTTRTSTYTFINSQSTTQKVTFSMLCQLGNVQRSLSVDVAPSGGICPSPCTGSYPRCLDSNTLLVCEPSTAFPGCTNGQQSALPCTNGCLNGACVTLNTDIALSGFSLLTDGSYNVNYCITGSSRLYDLNVSTYNGQTKCWTHFTQVEAVGCNNFGFAPGVGYGTTLASCPTITEVRAVADPNNLVAETNENNNVATYQVQGSTGDGPGFDIAVSNLHLESSIYTNVDLSFTPSLGTSKRNIPFSFEFRSPGKPTIWYNDTLIDMTGSATNIGGPEVPSGYTSGTIVFRIDHNNTIAESNENNNMISLNY